MKVVGTIGSDLSTANVNGDIFTLSKNKKTVMDSVCFICLQRVSPRLKTCDIVWVNDTTFFVQTVERNCIKELRSKISVPVYDIGQDPGAWKKWHTRAMDEAWTSDDWDSFLAVSLDSDSDYVPSSSSDDSEDSEDSDEEDEHPNKKRRKN